MKDKLLAADTERTFVLVLDIGEDALTTIEEWAQRMDIGAARVSAIGAFSDVVLGYLDWATREYVRIPVDEQVEVVSLLGDIATTDDGKPVLHAHVVVGRADGAALGGHLMGGHVRPTLEVLVIQSPHYLRRRHDPATGLALLDL